MAYFNKEYLDYIKSDRWKAKCAAYWYKHGKKCQACGKRQDLHVHHMSYEHLGREPLTDLAGLCHTCHREVHARHRKNRHNSLRTVTLAYIKQKRLSASKK